MNGQIHTLLNRVTKWTEKHRLWMLSGDFNLLPPGFYETLPENQKHHYSPYSPLTPFYQNFKGIPELKDVFGPNSQKWLTAYDMNPELDLVIDYIFHPRSIHSEQNRVRHIPLNLSDHMPVITTPPAQTRYLKNRERSPDEQKLTYNPATQNVCRVRLVFIMSALFVEQLTTIDFSYLCPERGLTGETWLVDVVLTGELNEEGMVFDFGHVKKEIKAMIDNYADHALLVPLNHPDISVNDDEQRRTATLTLKSGGHIACQTPQQAILPLPVNTITPEAIRPLLEQHVLKGLPENVQGIEMHLYPEDIQGAYFHYSHGLKKHQGDCQRIAHGHRSQIKIYTNNKRNNELESQVAGQWQDIYLATREDILDSKEVNGIEHLTFGYQAIQGHFKLQIPAKRCYLMDTDTTIELIATHLAQSIANDQQNGPVKVVVNEGFRKGAIGVARKPQ